MRSVRYGTTPDEQGPTQGLVGTQCKSAPACHKVEPPGVQNRGGGYELIYRTARTRPAT